MKPEDVANRRGFGLVKSHLWKGAAAVGMGGVALLSGAEIAGASVCNFLDPQGNTVVVSVEFCPEDPNYEPPVTNPPAPPPNTTPRTTTTTKR